MTRETPETAARRGTTPAALRREAEEEEAWKGVLCEAVATLAKEAETLPLRVSYAEVTERFGADVFGGKRSKLALDAVKEELKKRNMKQECMLREMARVCEGLRFCGRIPICGNCVDSVDSVDQFIINYEYIYYNI